MKSIAPKSFLVVIAVLALAWACWGSSGERLATCTGAADCKACKTCRYCKHCAKEGGSCGVSRAATRKAEASQASAVDCCEEAK